MEATLTFTPPRIAGFNVAGCRTFPPNTESSAASSKVISLIEQASFTILGSVEKIPATSVQISNVSAFTASANNAAEKSLPPLPKVVVLPNTSDPIKP